jgi:pantoate kinase
MRQASAFAPGHVTGFFQICDTSENLLQRGSRGCGASVTQGVKTAVRVEAADENSKVIKINGEVTNEAIVSENVLGKMLDYAGESFRVIIEHDVSTPLGAGFGSSGGGSISLSLALNEALDVGLTFIEAAQIAHISEIECRTGLGTVFAAVHGGFGVLVKAGGPGFGEAVFYEKPDDLALVYLYFGSMDTRKALSDSNLRDRINSLGGKYVDIIKQDLEPNLFMELSGKFTDYVKVKTHRLSIILDKAKLEKFPCAMAMFGEVAFSLVYKEEAEDIAAFYRSEAPDFSVDIVDIADRGARLI